MKNRSLQDILRDGMASPQQCDDCGKIAYVRPWGPNGTIICPKCGAKDPHGTVKRMLTVTYEMTEEEATERADFLIESYPDLFKGIL